MMYIKELIAAFAPHRGKALVVSGRAGRYWIEYSETASTCHSAIRLWADTQASALVWRSRNPTGR